MNDERFGRSSSFIVPSSSFESDTRQNLLTERVILHRAARFRREGEDRLFVCRALLEPDRLGDDRVEQTLAEDLADLRVNVARQRRSLVMHGDDYAEELQVRIGTRFDLLDGLRQVVRS